MSQGKNGNVAFYAGDVVPVIKMLQTN